MRKVTWPNRKQLITYTGVVIFATAIVALFIAVVDVIIVALSRLV
ncbi:MAG: preprotein translocase subunit SecE [Firmicutes bacterium]|nr:preprotein translocase subunit SecE [Bacillota bacterium]